LSQINPLYIQEEQVTSAEKDHAVRQSPGHIDWAKALGENNV
jgi:hypothetical protein